MECYFSLADEGARYIATERSAGPPDSDVSQSIEYRGRIEELAEKHSGSVTYDRGRKSHTRANPLEKRHFCGGGFIQHWDNVQAAFTTTAAAVAFLGAAKVLLLQWLKNKGSRSATFKMGDWKVSIKGSHDITQIIERITVLHPELLKAPKKQATKAKLKKSSKKRKV